MDDIIVTVFETDSIGCPDNCGMPVLLKDMIPWVQGRLDMVPAAYRDVVHFEVGDNGDYDRPEPSVSVYYARPETDSERRSREQHTEHSRAESDARERREFERLKAKFEGQRGEPR